MGSAIAIDDMNARVWGLLQDLASIQTSKQKRFGYKRAASSVFWLETPLDVLQQPDGSFPRIHGLGPASMRVVREALDSGGSPSVDRAVEESGRAMDVSRRRSLRATFLSRAQVLRILRDMRAPATPAPYRGDLQMHTAWSDGSTSIQEMVDAAARRGCEYCGITDHGRGLSIAGGLSADRVRAQQREITALNKRRGPCRALSSIEANIAADGSVDLYADDGLRFDLVVAAPHSKLRSPDDQTARLVTAIRTPGVHVIAHPRGRIAGSRAGIVADWPTVFAEAARRNVAVELDGDPARQDLDHTLARDGLKAGCVFALDSDAHAPSQLVYAETALAHARLAGIPSERVINTWPIEQLLAWVRDR